MHARSPLFSTLSWDSDAGMWVDRCAGPGLQPVHFTYEQINLGGLLA